MGDCEGMGWLGLLMGAAAIFVGWLLATIQYMGDEPSPRLKSTDEIVEEFKVKYREAIREVDEERENG